MIILENDNSHLLINKDNKFYHVSWYLSEHGQYVVDFLSSNRQENLYSDERADKCKYMAIGFTSFLDAYMYVVLSFNLQPSQVEMQVCDEENRGYQYSHSVAQFALKNTGNKL